MLALNKRKWGKISKGGEKSGQTSTLQNGRNQKRENRCGEKGKLVLQKRIQKTDKTITHIDGGKGHKRRKYHSVSP